MGLLQKAVETYDANASLIGVYREGQDPLAPVGHALTSADIEITLGRDGRFLAARKVEKGEPKALIPVTEESAGRTSGLAAHPLCEQVKYLSGENEAAYLLYTQGLQDWLESEDTHPFLQPIFSYVKGRTLTRDLSAAGILRGEEKDSEGLLAVWRVNGFEEEEPACWKNKNLFGAFERYYCKKIFERERVLCMLEGKEVPLAAQHPKGIVPINGNAKLISANDTDGFTYRGRFSQAGQAAAVGYIASQKAHNALRWLVGGQGIRSGNRVFLCWNPQGKVIPSPMRRFSGERESPTRKPSDYKKQLFGTLQSLREESCLKDTDSAILAAFDAATNGRLAVTYYNEIAIKPFLDRMHTWDAHCCWYYGSYGIEAPDLFTLVDCAFGTQRGGWLETDSRVQSQQLQRLLNSKVGGGVFPRDIVQALVNRASTPLAYSVAVWHRILQCACAALQKYRYDIQQGGEEMAWELDKKNRSFQYGRLLAIMERIEEDYYYKSQENRQTNAMKFMAEFRQRPFSVFERLNRHLHQAYLCRVEPWQADRYDKLTGEVFGILSEFPEEMLNKPLEDLYLMGYELQRNAFFVKKQTKAETEEE